MDGLIPIFSFALGCFSMALLIRYKQKKALTIAMAQKSQKKTNRVPVDVDFEEVDSID